MRYIFLVALLSLGHRVHSSCCSSTSAGGVGKLLPHERAIVQIGTALRHSPFFFDDHAKLKSLKKSNLINWQCTQKLHAQARLHNFFYPYVTLATKMQKSPKRMRAAFGDTSIGARVPVITQHMAFSPFLFSLIFSLDVPTGVSAKKDIEPEYITSKGLYKPGVFANIVKDINGTSLKIGYGISKYLDAQKKIKHGFEHAISFGLGFSPYLGGHITCGLKALFVGAKKIDDFVNKESSKRKITLDASWSHTINSHVKSIFGLGFDVPIKYMGKNLNSELFVNFALRFGVY